MSESNWADQVDIDPFLINEASKFKQYGKPDKHKFVLAMAQQVGLDVKYVPRAGWAEAIVPPVPGNDNKKLRTQTDAGYNMLAKIYDQLPEELKYADEKEGVVVLTNSVIPYLDLKPWLVAGMKYGDFSDEQLDAAKAAVANIDGLNDSKIANYLAQTMGLPLTDPRVSQAQAARRADVSSTVSVDASGFTAKPGSATPPPASSSTTEDQGVPSTTMPATTTTPTTPPAGAPGEMSWEQYSDTTGAQSLIPGSSWKSAEEYLQANPDRGVLDLRDKFGGQTFDFSGMPYTTTSFTSPDQKTVTLDDALRYPHTLESKEKIIDLQETLRKTGYFAAVGTLPLHGFVDAATVRAWQYALADSMRAGQSIDSYLDTRVKNYPQMLVNDQGYVLIRPETIENAAKSIGMEMIGRGLDQRELDNFAKYIRQWEVDMIMNAGFADNSVGDGAFTQAAQGFFDKTYEKDVTFDSFLDAFSGELKG